MKKRLPLALPGQNDSRIVYALECVVDCFFAWQARGCPPGVVSTKFDEALKFTRRAQAESWLRQNSGHSLKVTEHIIYVGKGVP